MAPTRPSVARNHEEDELLGAAFDIAANYGLLAYHPLPAQIRPGRYVTAGQGNAKGWPDAVFAGRGGQLFREFKATDGRVTPEQQTWIDMLTAGGADVAVWRPVDLRSGRITRELAAIKRPRPAQPAAGGDVTAVDVEVLRAALERIRETDPTGPAGRIATDTLTRYAVKEASRG